MITRNIFVNTDYKESIYKKNISFYLAKFVGFNVEEHDVSYHKISVNGIDTYLVVLKDDIRRIINAKGGKGVLRQKQWSIFVFNFLDYNIYVSHFGKNKNKKPIKPLYDNTSFENFEYATNVSNYKGIHPDNIYRNASINYLLHNYIYSILRDKYRFLFLNSYVYSVIGIINLKGIKSEYFTTYYYNTNHNFKSIPSGRKVIVQKEDINETTSMISSIKSELETIEKNYNDMSSLAEAYLNNLPLNPITSVNYENILKDINNKENFIITEGTARTGKTIIAMRLLGKFSESRLIIMNELFYKSLVEIFRIENIPFPNNRIICHTYFNQMSDWASNSKILIVDEAQRLNEEQIRKLVNDNKKNINILLGDNLQAINWKSDRGIANVENHLNSHGYEYKKYYFDYSIGLSSNVLYSIKYLIYNDVSYNNQSLNNYDINFFNNEKEFVNKYNSDTTYRKHMATLYMGCNDYKETINGFERWHVNRISSYPYFLDKDIKDRVMITTYELISRELDSVYIYIPNTITANSTGLHYEKQNLDYYMMNQLYVLFTRAKGEINVYCEEDSVYNYFVERNNKIKKNQRVKSTLSKEEKEKSIFLEDKITEKGITRLIHFTSKENVESIMKYGILSIKDMKEQGIDYVFNDADRFDNVHDGISLSIQNPNNWLLNRFKNSYSGREYVCLILDPALLYEITDDSGEKLAPRYYCNYNAASGSTQKSSSDFEIMFKDGFIAGSWNYYRRFDREGKEDNETTASQAEILFRHRIDPKYIIDIKDV